MLIGTSFSTNNNSYYYKSLIKFTIEQISATPGRVCVILWAMPPLQFVPEITCIVDEQRLCWLKLDDFTC